MEGLEGDSLRSILSLVFRGPQTLFAGTSLGVGPANPSIHVLDKGSDGVPRTGGGSRVTGCQRCWLHFILSFTLLFSLSVVLNLYYLFLKSIIHTFPRAKTSFPLNSEELLGPVDSLRPCCPAPGPPPLMSPPSVCWKFHCSISLLLFI